MKKHRWLRWLGIILLAIAGLFVGFVWWCLPGTHVVDHDVELPTRYQAGLFYAEPVTLTGQKMSLLLDTGGGTFVTRRCAERCGVRATLPFGGGRSRLPTFLPEAWVPEPTGGEKWMPVIDGEDDGMLGQRWFAGGVWTFAYPEKQVSLRRTPLIATEEMRRHAVPLGFRHQWGIRMGNQPRLVVTIDGESVESLLDTGAEFWPSPEALRVMDDQTPGEQATSFVSADLFERWRTARPDWRVIAVGCQRTREAAIEVPEAQVAGLKAGPVWFLRREPGNFTWMSSYMDKPIVASVGGNFLKNFRVTLDYPAAVAYWEKRPNYGFRH
jgi:hypothetical protein